MKMMRERGLIPTPAKIECRTCPVLDSANQSLTRTRSGLETVEFPACIAVRTHSLDEILEKSPTDIPKLSVVLVCHGPKLDLRQSPKQRSMMER